MASNTAPARPDGESQNRVAEAVELLRHEIAFMWRIHSMSYWMVKPVYPQLGVRHHLSLADWRIMISLARRPGLTANDIAALWGLDKMLINRGVRHLTERRLVRRTSHESDNRRRPLFLTKKGATTYAAVWPIAEHHYERITSVLSRDELASFSRMADKLIDVAQKIAQEEPVAAPKPRG